MNNQNKYGFAEVVDTLADSIAVYRIIKEPLSDGLQITDLLAVYNAYPLLREIYLDRNIFIQELLDLSPEESELVLVELSARTGIARDNVERVALESLSIATRAYGLIVHVLDEVKAIRVDINILLKVEDGPGGALAA